MPELRSPGALSTEEGQTGTGNAPEFTVSELSGAIKRTLESGLEHVRVRGELGRISRPASGHVYLDLKDERSVLAGVMWRGMTSRLRFQPEQGMEVVVDGSHPRAQLLVDVTGEEAHLLTTYRHHRPIDRDLAESTLLQHLFERCGKGQECLP